MKLNPKVDEYIAMSADFAKPILEHFRQIVHETCPEVTEAIKWGYPHFDYKDGIMCILAANKKHCTFSFYKSSLMTDSLLVKNEKNENGLGHIGKISSMEDMPSDSKLVACIKEAMVLNEKGIKKSRPNSDKPKEIETPAYFQEQLETNPIAKEIFENKSPSFRKDYLVWIIDAKSENTRQSRINQSLEWISEGKGRFWKYEK